MSSEEIKILDKFKKGSTIFKLFSNGTISKRYSSSDRNLKEYPILKELNNFYKPITHNNWYYDIVEAVEISRENGILMKIAPGVEMTEIDLTSEDYFLAGSWLGYFHSLSHRDLQVKRFGDYSFANIFISKEKKIFTPIDPSSKTLTEATIYPDILKFFSNSILYHIRENSVYNKTCISQFIKGYNEFTPFQFNEEIFNKDFNDFIREFKRVAIVHNGKLKGSIGYYLIKAYMKFHLKPYLRKLGKLI